MKKNVFIKAMAASIPLLVFAVGALALAFYKCPDEKGYWPVALLALAISILFSRKPNRTAQLAIQGMSEQLVSVMICAWLLSATLGQFLREAGLVPTLASFLDSASPGIFVVGVFLVASVVATSTGTAVGTILLVTPVLFPLGAAVDASPYMVLGAILAGGAFGDDYSPLSDTTIASANTQGVAIGVAVRNRIKYVLPAAVVACVLYFAFARGDGIAAVTENREIAVNSLVMLIPALAVIVLCFLRTHILTALLVGIMLAIVVGVLSGTVEWERLLSFDQDNYTAKSILIDGMNRGVGISIFSILLMGSVNVVRHRIQHAFSENALKSRLSAPVGEALIALIIVGVNSVLAHNTVTILATQEPIRSLRARAGLTGLRTAQIVDLAGNTVMHMLPYMVTVLVAVAFAAKDLGAYGLEKINPVQVGFSNFHSISLIGVLILVIASGLWRRDQEKGDVEASSEVDA